MQDLIDKLIIHSENEIKSMDNKSIDFKDYDFTEDELRKCAPILQDCIAKSKLFFWFGYKEALTTIKKESFK